jgi:aromatase
MSPLIRETEHSRVVSAPPDRLYALVADVSRWPVLLGPCIRARRVSEQTEQELIEIWAWANGQVTPWTSRRTLDPAGMRIGFRQERSAAPVAAMSGSWSFRPTGGGRTRVTLAHRFSAVADGPGPESAALDRITEAVDRNTEDELTALAAFAELGHPPDRLVFTFGDRMELPGVAVTDAYDFIHRADLWPERLPHVRRVDLREGPGGVQHMEMDTVTPDGLAHTTTSVRLCDRATSIAYKQTALPALLSGHSGVWEFERTGTGAAVTSRHTVALDPAAVERVLGPGTTPARARAHLRDALGANSRATMEAARGHALTASGGRP